MPARTTLVVRWPNRVGRWTAAGFLVAVLGGLQALGCGQPGGDGAGTARTIRLLDRTEAANVELADASRKSKAGLRRMARKARRRDGKVRVRGHTARLALQAATGGSEERLCLFGPAGARFRYRLDLPRDAVLTFGVGALPESPPEPAAEVSADLALGATGGAGDGPGDSANRSWEGEVRFRLLARPVASETEGAEPEEFTKLFERTVGVGLDAAWVDVEIDLAERLGPAARGPIELVFETEPGESRVGETRAGRSDWALISSPEIRGRDQVEAGWNVVLISLDTLRADHLGSYGYERDTSPWMDAYAERSFRFATAVSTAPWTYPAHRSLFSGLYPQSHGGLEPKLLAERLWEAGYRTEAWTGGGVMHHRLELSSGFDTYRIHDWLRQPEPLEAALEAGTGRKRFVFLHTYEPHDPYVSTTFAEGLPSGRLDGYFDENRWKRFDKELTAEEKVYIKALYDGDIRFTDDQLGALLDRLAGSDLLSRAIVVITSDHGEQFWEHGTWRHGQNLYDHQLLVPLIVHVPKALRRELGIAGDGEGVIGQQVRLIDVLPTVFELLGLPVDPAVQGRSLVPLLRGEKLSEVDALAEHVHIRDTIAKAVRFRGFKYVRTLRGADPPIPEAGDAQELIQELYDLGTDPREQSNLADERAELRARFEARLDELVGKAWTEQGLHLEDLEADPELRKQLEALGYLGN